MGFADYFVELSVPGYGLLAVAVMSPAKITGQINKISLVALQKNKFRLSSPAGQIKFLFKIGQYFTTAYRQI